MKRIIKSAALLCFPIVFLFMLIFSPSAGLNENGQDSGYLSGSGEDIVKIALSQTGNVGGSPYWSWYGFENRVPWCACFVSWCANEAGYIDSGIIPKYAACREGVRWFKEHEQWGDNSYSPKPGDIVFFDWNLDGVSDHTGIVQYVEGDKVVTVEGNTSSGNNADGDHVEQKVRGRTYILGFGTPLYPFSGSDLTGNSVEEQVYNYLISAGFSKASACGILGNMYQESGVNPAAVQGGGKGPAAGICQWENYNTKSGRWKHLDERAASSGQDWKNLKVQLDFLMYELQGGDPTTKILMDKNYGGLGKFQEAENVAWATEAFEKCFERAGKPNMQKRIAKAWEYYERF